MSALSVPAAYYAAGVADFIGETPESILGALTARSAFAVDPPQRDAWLGEIAILKIALAGIEGSVFLEFDVPRIGSRIDAVLITGPAVFAIEFKVGEREFNTRDYNQVWDYALDLKNFHLASHAAPIVPVLVATDATDHEPKLLDPADDGVFPPVTCNVGRLGEALRLGLSRVSGATLDPLAWARAPYQPTPTIIEAAPALYAHHSVDAIARNDAGARNLGITSKRVEEIIDLARTTGRKAIVFVTGVPRRGQDAGRPQRRDQEARRRPDACGVPVWKRSAGESPSRGAGARRDVAPPRQAGPDAQGRGAAEDQGVYPERPPLPR
jgi:hypothetical protein